MVMTRDEYMRKLEENQKISGFGDEVRIDTACPFCAEPGFCSYLLFDVHEAMSKPSVCKHCGRGARAVFQRSGSSTRMEIVQTCGDDPPEYARMRRIEAIRIEVLLNGERTELPLLATFDDVVKASKLTGSPSITLLGLGGKRAFIFAPGQTHELQHGDRITAVHT